MSFVAASGDANVIKSERLLLRESGISLITTSLLLRSSSDCFLCNEKRFIYCFYFYVMMHQSQSPSKVQLKSWAWAEDCNFSRSSYNGFLDGETFIAWGLKHAIETACFAINNGIKKLIFCSIYFSLGSAETIDLFEFQRKSGWAQS